MSMVIIRLARSRFCDFGVWRVFAHVQVHVQVRVQMHVQVRVQVRVQVHVQMGFTLASCQRSRALMVKGLQNPCGTDDM